MTDLRFRRVLVIACALAAVADGNGQTAPDPLAARSNGRRGARGARRREQDAHVLRRRGTARGRGAGRGIPPGAGLDLPQQDGIAAALMADRPSLLYRLSIRLGERALPVAARFDKKVARGI